MDSSMDLSNPNPFEVFNHPAFGFVRVVVKDGEPWFVGKDVAEVLGYKDASRALFDHVDTEDKTSLVIQQSGSNYKAKTTVINEGGLYSLMLRSKLPQAKDFKRWVTSEVLPSIRKHGGYLTREKVEEILADPDSLIKLALQLKQERQARERLQRLPYLTCERFYLPYPYVSLCHFKLFPHNPKFY